MEDASTLHHIVLADDDADHALLFERVLHELYPRAIISFIGEAERLLPFLHLHPVDLLFLDIRMPCKNGYECLQEIRKDSATHHLPVIVYSSSAHIPDMQRAFSQGADFYMVKPFTTEHLKTALRRLLAENWKAETPLRSHYFINNRFVPFTANA